MISEIAVQMDCELRGIRHDLHKIPETAFLEFETSAYIKNKLTEWNIPFTTAAKTGVVGLIRGAKPGKTVLLRADIDALPIPEENTLPFRSVHPGNMHACGHDIHMTCLLGAAKILNQMKDKLSGNVKLVFQPAEEGVGGALPMIEEGIMENPPVDGAFALHVEPLEEVGGIQIKDGAIMASPDDFELTVHGVGGHGAHPHKCVDPILVGSMIVNAYQTVVSRHFDPMTPCVVSVCSFHAGSCTNAIPDTAELTGTARSLDPQTRKELIYILEKIAKDTAASMGATVDFTFKPLYPPTINDKQMNRIVENACGKVDGVKRIVHLDMASMAGEDFAYFCERVPASYFKLGVGMRDEKLRFPIHSPNFIADEDSLRIGAAVMAQAAADFLNL